MNKKILWLILALVAVVIIAVVVLYFQDYIAPSAQFSGTVSYRERIALPAGSQIVAQIRDVSSGSPQVIAETKITTQGENVPIPFTIGYNPSRINTNGSYDVYATIAVNGQIKWANVDYTPFLENGAPITNADLMLVFAETAIQASAVDLSGKIFRAAYFNGTEVPSGASYTLSFDTNTLVAQICNMMSGSFDLSNNMLSGNPITTEKFCTSPDGIMEIEDAFKSMLTSGADVEFSGDTLTLSSNGQSIVFIQQ